MSNDVGEHDRRVRDEIKSPPWVQNAIDDGARTNLWRNRVAASNVALTTAKHRSINGKPQARVTRSLRSTDEFGDKPSIAPRVHLKPLVDVWSCLGDFFNRAGRHR